MFSESYTFKLLAQLVLAVAEVKLHWQCQKAAAAACASQSAPEQADDIQRTQTAAPAGARPLDGCSTTKSSSKARKDALSCSFR